MDDEEIEVRVRFPRMTSFSAPESKTNRSVEYRTEIRLRKSDSIQSRAKESL
jgi:hypothetical protein